MKTPLKKNRWGTFALCAGAFALFVVASLESTRASEPKTLLSWDFENQDEVDAWKFNCLTKPVAKDGKLTSTYTSWDPFVVSPQFELKPRPGQYVEIRMKSTGFYVGEIFFASSNEGQYGGFSQEKTASWDIVHDGEFHTYQILPAWLAEPQIIKIRVDLGRPSETEIKEGADLEIDYIRIIDINIDATAAASKFDWSSEDLEGRKIASDRGRDAWISEIGEIDPAKVGSNLFLEWEKKPSSKETPFPRASLRCLTSTKSGVVTLEIPLFGLCSQDLDNPNYFARNVDLSCFDAWGDKIYRWELSTPSGFALKRLAFARSPQGFGALEKQGDGQQIALARLSSEKVAKVEYETLLRNCGGAALDAFRASSDTKNDALKLERVVAQKVAVDPLLGFNPTGDRLAALKIDDSNVDKTLIELEVDPEGKIIFPKDASLAPGEAFRLLATYEVRKAGKLETRLAFNAKSAVNGETKNVGVNFTPRLNVLDSIDVPRAEYAPEPKPLESDYEIGAFYFPGWSKRSGWDKIDAAAPVRKPLLGWYDEANPEVVDWQIKWAAENGIQFFFVDWYWKRGTISLDHWIRAFQKAKYRSCLKWAVMWANHTGYGTHSSEDWKVVTKYWIDNYFNTPEYYKIDGKPVVVMWDHSIVDHDMIEEAKKEGLDLKPGEGCKRAFDLCRKLCVEAGLPGVYFIAIKWPEHSPDLETVQRYANAGFDATTIYHFMYPGNDVEDKTLYSFDKVVDASKPNWEERNKTGVIPFIPNISTGWDSRPWHGFRSTVVYDRSVESFRRLLQDYKDFADETGVKRVVLAPLNEWGEGSYIEPNNEFGFGMYEAIRETLCKKPAEGFPVNFAPYEVGLGPYDLPKEK